MGVLNRSMAATSALILLAGIYTGSEYGGRMSSILLNVPGDAGAVMTTPWMVTRWPKRAWQAQRWVFRLSAPSSAQPSLLSA